MTQNRFTPDFCSKSIQGFCRLTPPQLTALKEELGLTVSTEGLRFCQRHFTAMHRDPLVGDLLFLGALAARLYSLPQTMRLEELHFEDPSAARVWQDICRMRKALKKDETPTLLDVMQTATQYLLRAGRGACATALCGTTAELSLATRGNLPREMLQTDQPTMVLQKPTAHPAPHAGQLLLALDADKDHSLANTVSRFWQAFAHLSPIPIMVIGEEGLGVHLAELPLGVELDTLCMTEFAKNSSTAALMDACRNTAIFAVDANLADAMLTSGAPLRLIGRLLPHDLIILKNGMTVMLSLSREVLGKWYGTHALQLTVPREARHGEPTPVHCHTANGQIFGSVMARTAALPQLMHLLSRVFAAGANLKSATLGAVLTHPCDSELSPQTLPLLLDLHRFTAELALPLAGARVITAAKGEAPTLTVFISTKANAPADSAAQELMQNALALGDFAQMRSLIYRLGNTVC